MSFLQRLKTDILISNSLDESSVPQIFLGMTPVEILRRAVPLAYKSDLKTEKLLYILYNNLVLVKPQFKNTVSHPVFFRSFLISRFKTKKDV